jgi:hypothetical protein
MLRRSRGTLAPLAFAEAWLSGRERGVLKLVPHDIGTTQEREILLEPQAMEHVRDGPNRHARFSPLHGAECWARHTSSLRDQLGRKPAPTARQTDVLAQLPEEARNGWQRGRGGARHGNYYLLIMLYWQLYFPLQPRSIAVAA